MPVVFEGMKSATSSTDQRKAAGRVSQNSFL